MGETGKRQENMENNAPMHLYKVKHSFFMNANSLQYFYFTRINQKPIIHGGEYHT